jgi:hypothetical protein
MKKKSNYGLFGTIRSRSRRLILCLALTGLAPALPAQGLPWAALIGADGGLYSLNLDGTFRSLWTGGAVRKILRSGDFWAVLGDQGVLVSQDLETWEPRNQGLPVKTLKVFEGGQRSFISLIQELKDLEFNPENPDIMVCATKDLVYLSRDRGLHWENWGAPPLRANGIKAVAVANLPEPTVFLSHSIYGVYYTTGGGRWTELNEGLEALETTGNADEVSDIAVSLPSGNPAGPPALYAAQTFRRRIYRLDWEGKRFDLLWGEGGEAAEVGGVDSLDIGDAFIRFVREGAVAELPRDASPQDPRLRRDLRGFILDLPESQGIVPQCLVLRAPQGETVTLSELWLLNREGAAAPRPLAEDREGIYLPVNHAGDPGSLRPYMELIENRELNMVVIDMKDDYGRLRFTPQNPELARKGRVFRPLDIDGLLKTLKDRGIYTAARVVVFKDPELAGKEGGKYAVWDSQTNQAWEGYAERRQPKPPPGDPPPPPDPLVRILPAEDPAYEILRTYYDERWVDPYSEEVWEYIAGVSQELHRRGFDEIQFDYIRFPTDGVNLGSARYRWRDPGMDMESAILSFLRHVRSRIDAPISIDIYGANGWYRTGARTGQEVELLSPYVDVICPMYYPSHFEQHFLAQAPEELRPFRIYYQGTRRTALIGRNRIIVRPYVQAFFLNVSYDRRYYGPDYVRRELEGVRAAGRGGLTYWNNSGRYEDIPLPPPPEGGP